MAQSALSFPPPIPADIQVRIDRAMSDPDISPCAKAVLIQLIGYPATGSNRAVSIQMLRSTFAASWVRQYSPRDIKGAVRELIMERGVPIGSARGKLPGYYLLSDPCDREKAIRVVRAQALADLKRWRALDDDSAIALELAGQMSVVALGGGAA